MARASEEVPPWDLGGWSHVCIHVSNTQPEDGRIKALRLTTFDYEFFTKFSTGLHSYTVSGGKKNRLPL
jgi:hypothetical protein